MYEYSYKWKYTLKNVNNHKSSAIALLQVLRTRGRVEARFCLERRADLWAVRAVRWVLRGRLSERLRQRSRASRDCWWARAAAGGLWAQSQEAPGARAAREALGRRAGARTARAPVGGRAIPSRRRVRRTTQKYTMQRPRPPQAFVKRVPPTRCRRQILGHAGLCGSEAQLCLDLTEQQV